MAEADWHRCREQFGYSVRGPEFFPAEKKVRHSIRADYAVGDDTFVRTMGTLLGRLLEREQNYTAGKRRSDLPGNAERRFVRRSAQLHLKIFCSGKAKSLTLSRKRCGTRA
jgi:hypothetical protein